MNDTAEEKISPSAWAPLRIPMFRTLWIATIFSNIGTWIHDVGAGWLMISLSPSPLMVSLVQTAGTLPMFILALPAGALSDIFDRRKLLIVSQSWMLIVAISLALLAYLNLAGAWSLLIMTFCLSLGAAVSLPAWSAIVPELVSRADLPPALALNSMGINISRAIGPAIGGYIISSFGIHWAFLLNGVSFIIVLIILCQWKSAQKESPLPAERFISAMRLGVRFAKNSPEFKSVLYRTAAFIIPASVLWALLPLITKQLLGGDSSDYGILLTFIGVGAVFGATILPRLKNRFSVETLVGSGIVLLAGVIALLGFSRNFLFDCFVMLIGGMAWLTLLSSLNVAAQTSIPSWVRARAMAIYFMLFFFGGMAGGSLIWGALATKIGIPLTLYIDSATLVLGLVSTRSYRLSGRECLNLAPSLHWPAPTVAIDMNQNNGPVLVTVEYKIAPTNTDEFLKTMEGVKLGRMRDGALHWGLFQDTEYPGRFVENFIVESWAEHMRQHDRVTEMDKTIQEKAWAFHVEQSIPKVSHYLNVL
jgi:MFS family permease